VVCRTVCGSVHSDRDGLDFANPAIDPDLKRYLRGSNDIGDKERIKLMKLLWDAVGSEFGGRHELYERDYAGNDDREL
jgi:4-hydroxyphenylacetate 3-monooxygenase